MPRLAHTARASLAVAFGALAFGAFAGPAGASVPEVGIEDQNVVYGPDAAQILPQWRTLGNDWVRIQAYWDGVSPDKASTTRPAGFDVANPNDPRYDWASLDRAIDAVRANGMRVMLTVNQVAPRWGSEDPSVAVPGWRPSPALYGQFATALARRYGSRVDRWLVGSEPNQRLFLTPQYSCRGRKCTAEAPRIYRNLLNAAYPAIKAADPGAQVLIGELAPIGGPPGPASGLKPMTFIRELACVDKKFKPLKTPACRRFQAPKGDGFGYHPYVNNRRAPNVPQVDKDLAKIGDLDRLLQTLDRLTRAKRLRASTGRFNLFLTEYGYISNPPKPRYGVALETQALYNAQSAYVVWQRRNRVKLITQYLWHDDETFGTGLLFRDGRPKPALYQYAHPFFIDTAVARPARGRARSNRRAKALFWGQVRPDAQPQVTLQERKRGSSEFRTIATVRTGAGGYWSKRLATSPGAAYRFQYQTAGGPLTSGTVAAPRR